MIRLRRLLSRFILGERNPLFDSELKRLRSLPGAHTAIAKEEFFQSLRHLAQRKPQTEDELAILEAELFQLSERVGASDYVDDIPHEFWHFVADADIRFKDPSYGENQIRKILEWIEKAG